MSWKISKALVHRWFYLLFKGMWRGESAFTFSAAGRILIVATVRESIKRSSISLEKVFYEDKMATKRFE